MISLRGLTWDHPRGYGPLLASSDPYAEANGVRVSWESRSLKDFGDASISDLAKDYDLLVIDHPHVGLAAASGCLLPLEQHLDVAVLATFEAESAGPSFGSYTFAGRQWALPVDASMQASAYREDLLGGPFPKNWFGVLELGESLREQGRYLAVPLVPTDTVCSFLTLCASLSSPPGVGNVLVADEVGHQALTLLRDLHALAHPESATWNPIGLLEHMSRENDVVYCPLTFTYTNYSRDGYRPHLVRFHDLPGVDGALLGGAGIAVSSTCAYPEAAVAYAAWLCSAEVQRDFYLIHGGQPGNLTAWHDEAANKLTHGFFRDTLKTLQHAYVRPRSHGFVPFQEAAGLRIRAFLLDGTSPKDCLAGLERLYQTHLGEG